MPPQRSQQKYRSQRKPDVQHDVAGTLFIVGTPIGSPDDITLRALNILKRVSTIAAETPLATQSLLAHHGISANITTYGPVNREEKLAVLLQHLREGHDIALVSDSGMPVIYDPGSLLVAAALEAALPVAVVPGPSAITAATALSGYSGDRIVFEGRLPRTIRQLDKFFVSLKQESRTTVIFLSCADLSKFLDRLARGLRTRQVTLAINMTKEGEQLYRGRPARLLACVTSLPLNADITLVVAGNRKKNSARKLSKKRK